MAQNTASPESRQAVPRQSTEDFVTVLKEWADRDCRYRERRGLPLSPEMQDMQLSTRRLLAKMRREQH